MQVLDVERRVRQRGGVKRGRRELQPRVVADKGLFFCFLFICLLVLLCCWREWQGKGFVWGFGAVWGVSASEATAARTNRSTATHQVPPRRAQLRQQVVLADARRGEALADVEERRQAALLFVCCLCVCLCVRSRGQRTGKEESKTLQRTPPIATEGSRTNAP